LVALVERPGISRGGVEEKDPDLLLAAFRQPIWGRGDVVVEAALEELVAPDLALSGRRRSGNECEHAQDGQDAEQKASRLHSVSLPLGGSR